MLDILTRACCFVGIILLGFILRQTGFFKEGDFHVLSKITLKITLPATFVVSLSQMTIEPSMLIISAIIFGVGVLYICVAFLINLRADKDKRAFEMLNLPSYNIGLFALPLVQGFLGPVGVATTSLCDLGNAFICLGGAYGVASAVKDGSKFSFRRIGKALLTSVPFMTYIILIPLNLAQIKLPAGILSFADIIKGANTFLAMLMIGVGIKIDRNANYTWQIVRLLLVRYSIAAVLAAVFYYLLPFALEVRQTMVLLAFSPVSSATPAFTAEMKGDVSLAAAYHTAAIVCSMIIMTGLMLVML